MEDNVASSVESGKFWTKRIELGGIISSLAVLCLGLFGAGAISSVFWAAAFSAKESDTNAV